MTHPTLRSCPSCAGFAPAAATTCPHCDSALATPRRFGRVLAQLLGSAGLAVTLMACYGAVAHPQAYPDGNCQADSDGDGACMPQDCNDADPAIYPGAEDNDGDTVDQNCDGVDGWRDPGSMADPATPATPETDPVAPAPSP